MQLKLSCKLKFKGQPEEDKSLEYLVDEINLVEFPKNLNDDQVKIYTDNIKKQIKLKYIELILEYFDVELKEIQE